MILVIFLLLEIMKKNIYNEKRKKNGADLEWATAQLYFKRMGIVLQYRICIAVRNLGWAKIVLQYTGLYCSDGG